MSRQLPPQSSLRQLKSQAKDLRRACEKRDPAALARVREHHPKHSNRSDADLVARPLSLQDAQLVIAREYGHDSWPRLAAAVGEANGAAGAAAAALAGPLAGIVGGSAAAQRLREEALRAASVRVPALLVGEKGSGKRLLARLIHEASGRSQGPFVQMACDVSPELLGDSDLLGHEPGAFTGANATRRGKVEEAAGGTLLLDEAGALSAAAQLGLLGAIDRGMSQRVGGAEEIAVDVRLVATSTRDLRAAMESGALREDLYYSLQAVCIELPPLREHVEDIPELARHFVASAVGGTAAAGITFTDAALARLAAHDWPGNVRELRHAVEGAVAAAGAGNGAVEVGVEHLRLRSR